MLPAGDISENSKSLSFGGKKETDKDPLLYALEEKPRGDKPLEPVEMKEETKGGPDMDMDLISEIQKTDKRREEQLKAEELQSKQLIE